jgi:cytochrome c peroxidase
MGIREFPINTKITMATAKTLGLCSILIASAAFAAGTAAAQGADGGNPMEQSFIDASGVTTTLSTNGPVDGHGAFFQSLGTNGRSCATCHVASQAMSISATGVQIRFAETRGRDPLFAAVDGANCPNARPDSAADHSLLLQHGLIRIFLKPPAGAPFSISVVHDPYGCAITTDPTDGRPIVSVYRRPLPTTNLGFLSTIMFDGRETKQPLNARASFPLNLAADLTQQAIDAVAIHAQGTQAPSAAQLDDIIDFELGLYSAQSYDNAAGILRADGAYGGPSYLATALSAAYYPGMNDSLGADPTGVPFNASAMTLYSAWASPDKDAYPEALRREQARKDIAAGEKLFDSAPVQISNVRGLNDNPALGSPSTFAGTCTTCHDTPNAGNHSFPLPLDIGTGHSVLPGTETDTNIAAGLAELSMPNLPVYEIKGCSDPFNPGQPASFYTSDPGKALVSGLCSDFNRGKGPILRGLAARAPYFHNGAAADLNELINFYNKRFQMNLTDQQKRQLVVFLNSL